MGSPRKQLKSGIPFPVGIPIKKLEQKRRGRSSSGKEKGLLPTPLQRTCARRSRAYKWEIYTNWIPPRSPLPGGKGAKVNVDAHD